MHRWNHLFLDYREIFAVTLGDATGLLVDERPRIALLGTWVNGGKKGRGPAVGPRLFRLPTGLPLTSTAYRW
jgi:hypothetical protein